MIYRVSPYYLTMWGPEYFVVCNVPSYDNPSHFRVEMMVNVEMLDDDARPVTEIKELKDIGKKGRTIADYVRESVHLWDGEPHRVTISGINFIRQGVMRKFGNNLIFIDKPDDRFSVTFNVAGSEGLYQWLAKYGSNVKLEGPEEDIKNYINYLKCTLEQYEV